MRRSFGLVGTSAAALLALACASGTARTPAAAAPAGPDVVGRFVWHDLVTRDVAACRAFYGALLGWKFETKDRNGSPYVVAREGDAYVAGFVERKEMTEKEAAWVSYLAVSDLEASLAQVQAKGGSVLLTPRPIGAYGRVAVVRDPQGAPLGLASVTAALPAEPAEPALRRFFWMEYLAKDAPAALAFYRDLAGYESRVTVTENGVDYNVLRRQRSRAGLLKLPATFEGAVQPNWLPYIRVDDPAAFAAKARALGGEIVLAPGPGLRHGTLAVVSDPTGGVVALQKWPL